MAKALIAQEAVVQYQPWIDDWFFERPELRLANLRSSSVPTQRSERRINQ